MDKELKVVAFQENLGGVEGSTGAVLSAKELVQVCACIHVREGGRRFRSSSSAGVYQ